MKLGVRAHDFGRMEPQALVETIGSAGFETAQLALVKAITGVNSFSEVTVGLLERIRHAFESSGVGIGVLGCYVEIGHPDKETRLKEVEKFMLGLEHAKELGVKLTGTETTGFPASAESEPLREQAYQSLKDSVLRMTEHAEKLGVDVAVETVADHTLNSAALTRRLLDEVGSARLKVILDPVNLILSDADMKNQDEIFRSFLETVGGEVAALHVKDIVLEDGEKIWRNIGRGQIRYEPVFRWFRENSPDIPVLREHVKPESFQIDLEAMRHLAG